jgi:hypothetical protein
VSGRLFVRARQVALALVVTGGALVAGTMPHANASACVAPKKGTWVGVWDAPSVPMFNSGSWIAQVTFTKTGKGDYSVSGSLAVYGSEYTNGGALTGTVQCGAYSMTASNVTLSGTFVTKTTTGDDTFFVTSGQGSASGTQSGFLSRPQTQISPASGPQGTYVTITVGGFIPRMPIDVTYATRLPDPNAGAELCSGYTDDTGAMSCATKIPAGTLAGSAGTHRVTAENPQSGQRAHTNFHLL